jgi:hypothetical protein
MNNEKVWFITGASSGMGASLAKAALAAGDAVVVASPEVLIWPELSILDYAERSAAQRAWWTAQNGQQPGDPDKLAAALLTIANEEPPPRRFIAGADVIASAERRIAELEQQIESHRDSPRPSRSQTEHKSPPFGSADCRTARVVLQRQWSLRGERRVGNLGG